MSAELDTANALWEVLLGLDANNVLPFRVAHYATPTELERERLKLKEQQERVQLLEQGLALKDAITLVLPGWRELDVSDVLGRQYWDAYISDSKEDWIAWLVARGVEHKENDRHDN